MIDWVSAVLDFPHSSLIHGGARVYITPDGEASAPVPNHAIVRGSFDNTCAIQSSREGVGHRIHISGSPKFLQGHNLFGIDNPAVLAALMARQALAALGVQVDDVTFRRWRKGQGVKLTVVDITYMLDVGCETNAALFIEAIAHQSHMTHRGRGENRNGTLYFGRHSRRWAMKLYRKFVEINSRRKLHALPADIPWFEELREYARGTVRAELRLLSMELKKLGLSSAKNWDGDTARKVWEAKMAKLEITGNVRLTENIIEKLPRRLRSTYALWSTGRDVAALLSKSTYYQHRKDFKKFGIDIACAPAANDSPRVIPFLRVIEARPKGIPSWAYQTPLLAA